MFSVGILRETARVWRLSTFPLGKGLIRTALYPGNTCENAIMEGFWSMRKTDRQQPGEIALGSPR
jgi:hypothetical protein